MTAAVRRFPLRKLLLVAAIVAWALVLRPQWLGGPAAYVLVRGDSMLPTFNNGDFVVAYPQATYNVGDIVAYRVPAGEVGAGHIVVHRISAETATGFEFQGDNNPDKDPWVIGNGDLAGKIVLRIPSVGLALAFFLQPVVAGGLAAAVVVMALIALWTSKPSNEAPSPVRDPRSAARRRPPAGLRVRVIRPFDRAASRAESAARSDT